MSLTGYRTLVIFAALLESPKTNAEINDCLFNNQYIKERFSSDTLRIYINSLRAIGCEIRSANKSISKKYELLSHPFEYNPSKSQLKALYKLSKSGYEKIDVEDVILIDNFFNKLSGLIKNDATRDSFYVNSILKGVDKTLVGELLAHCKKKNQITFLYNSPKSGVKEIEIVADKFSIKSNKLYLWGNNLTHMQYSYFLVDRITKICRINLKRTQEDCFPTKIIYELYNRHEDYIPDANEKILEKTKDKFIIEITSKYKFSLMQKFLYLASDCKVIEPKEFQEELLIKLKLMEQSYESI